MYPALEDLQKFFPKDPPKINPQQQAESDAEHARMVKQVRKPTTSPVNPATAIVLDQNQCPPLQFGIDGDAPAHFDRLVVINVTDCPYPGFPVRMCMNGEPFSPGESYTRPALFQVIRGKKVPSSARPIYTPNQKEVSPILSF